MLHELLLALSGYPGDIFVLQDNGKIEVVGELPFIHPTETALLNRICNLASHYTYFVKFLQKHGHCPGEGSTMPRCGLYLKALCQGLDHVLEPYRHSLLELEKELLADPHLSVVHIQTVLEEYQILFPALSSVLQRITLQKIHGCNILETLHKASVCGIPKVKETLLRLLHVCHSVLYKQMASWLLHGILIDRHEEFFIKPVRKRALLSSYDHSTDADDDDLDIGGLTGRQMRQILNLTDDQERSPSFERYGIDASQLPSYIPTRVAEKILFVGESVQMFESDKLGTKHKHRGSIMRGQEDVFVRDLHALSQTLEFDLMTFEEVMDKIRVYVAEQLWKLVVEEADLGSELRTLKDFYLLGRGELFLAFIDQAQQQLQRPPTRTTEYDVNMAFQHAARNVLFEDELLLQRFRLTTESVAKAARADGVNEPPPHQGMRAKQSQEPDATNQQGGTAESGWNCLNMTYKVEWPLHVLFTPTTLERYGSLFRFLLYVKRVQLELQQCWAQGMRCKTPGSLPQQWWLRNHMAFLVDNLQYYLQVDVIESQYSVLLEKIQATRDFEAIRLAHDHFLTSLLSQSFLLMKPIAHCLHELLDISHQFCVLLGGPDNTLTSSQSSRLEDIDMNFRRQSNLLFKILSSVRNHQASPHLAQLLLRIDFNKYFTLAGGQLGGTLSTTTSGTTVSASSRT